MSAANPDGTVSAANPDTALSAANPDTEPEVEVEVERGPRGASRTAEEDVAAVIAILTALTTGAGQPSGPTGPTSVWADQGHLLRARLSPGPGSWWASGLPR